MKKIDAFIPTEPMKEGKYKVSTNEMDTAYFRYLIYYAKSSSAHGDFWNWLGEGAASSYSPADGWWYLSADQHKKIMLMGSPYWITLMKAYEIKHADG